MKKLFQALKERHLLKNALNKFDANSREAALELGLAFLLAYASEGISKDEWVDLEERFNKLKAARKD